MLWSITARVHHVLVQHVALLMLTEMSLRLHHVRGIAHDIEVSRSCFLTARAAGYGRHSKSGMASGCFCNLQVRSN